MNFLAITTPELWTWNETWLVTGLGFCMVLMLLCVFVFVIKGLGMIMQRLTNNTDVPKATKQPEKTYAKDADDATKAAIAMSLNLAGGDEEKAAVAYALHLYFNSLHDIEAPRLTITHHATAWKR